ncbi:MAG: hypothetical protein IPK26_26780 [Planctomycetes bacterium]|nr:hypothetical protein [Planctomycetota bacterium]
MDPTRPTAELITRARTGDAAAREWLCRHWLPRVRGLAAVRMGRTLLDLCDDDDIVQETMLAALRGLDQLEPRPDGSLVGWLARIVEHKVANAARQGGAARRGGGQVQRRADLGVSTLSGLAGADAGRSPSQEAAAHELDPALERALLALGSPRRELVYCRLVLELDFATIAQDLGLANGDSARALFHKALAVLRERLGAGQHDEPAR